MGSPFEALVDGMKIEELPAILAGTNLTAYVLPRAKWSKAYQGFEGPAELSMFSVAAANYVDLEEQLRIMENKMVTMGEILTLTHYKKPELTAELTKGLFYDIVVTGCKGANRNLLGGGRISTSDGKIPELLTLDELQFLAIESLGITLEQAKHVRAKIVPMNAWTTRGSLLIAGFEFSKGYGVRISHRGGVENYGGHTTEELREHLGMR